MAARGPGDRGINFLPLPHTYGSCVFNAAVMAGSTLIMIPRFDAETVLRAIGEHRATLMDGVPTTSYYLAPRLDSAAEGKRQICRRAATKRAQRVVIPRSGGCIWASFEVWVVRSGASCLEWVDCCGVSLPASRACSDGWCNARGKKFLHTRRFCRRQHRMVWACGRVGSCRSSPFVLRGRCRLAVRRRSAPARTHRPRPRCRLPRPSLRRPPPQRSDGSGGSGASAALVTWLRRTTPTRRRVPCRYRARAELSSSRSDPRAPVMRRDPGHTPGPILSAHRGC
ncbi:MAG: AMP-binding protein [Solirubrobacteraceae bacterium]